MSPSSTVQGQTYSQGSAAQCQWTLEQPNVADSPWSIPNPGTAASPKRLTARSGSQARSGSSPGLLTCRAIRRRTAAAVSLLGSTCSSRSSTHGPIISAARQALRHPHRQKLRLRVQQQTDTIEPNSMSVSIDGLAVKGLANSTTAYRASANRFSYTLPANKARVTAAVRNQSNVSQDRCRRPASSARWRSLRPPNVLLGETRQLIQNLGGLHAPDLGERQQHVKDLRGLQVRGRVEQQRTNRHPAGLEVALELRAKRTNLVRPAMR